MVLINERLEVVNQLDDVKAGFVLTNIVIRYKRKEADVSGYQQGHMIRDVNGSIVTSADPLDINNDN